MISRVHSLDQPIAIEEGMVFALETYCAASDGEERVILLLNILQSDQQLSFPIESVSKLRA